jgi:hypothetical protein
MPPAPSTGNVDGVDDLGDQHHRADLAGVSAGLGTLGDDDVDTGRLVALGVNRPPGECADQSTLFLDAVDQELRWWAEGVGDERRAVCECDLQLRARRGRTERSDTTVATRRPACGALFVGRELGHVVPAQDVVDELAVRVGDQGPDVVQGVSAALVTGVLRRHDQVDAVRAVAEFVLDPLQVDLELLGRMGDGTQHAETARLRDGGHDIAAVAEREDRELDSQHLRGCGLHRYLLNSRGHRHCCRSLPGATKRRSTRNRPPHRSGGGLGGGASTLVGTRRPPVQQKFRK